MDPLCCIKAAPSPYDTLPAQCISSIEQTVRSVCVSESVSESVRQNEFNALQIAIFNRALLFSYIVSQHDQFCH